MSIVRTMVGILPLWGSREYFVHRFSTNILTSLATGVPLVMSREAMKVYSFMDEGAVYLQVHWADSIATHIDVWHIQLSDTYIHIHTCIVTYVRLSLIPDPWVHLPL